MNVRLMKKTFHISRVFIICFLAATVISLLSIKDYLVIKQDEKLDINISFEHPEINHHSKKESSISYRDITSPAGTY